MKIITRRRIGHGVDEEIDMNHLRSIIFKFGDDDKEIEVSVRGDSLMINAWACGLIMRPVATNQIEVWRSDVRCE